MALSSPPLPPESRAGWPPPPRRVPPHAVLYPHTHSRLIQEDEAVRIEVGRLGAPALPGRSAIRPVLFRSVQDFFTVSPKRCTARQTVERLTGTPTAARNSARVASYRKPH